MKAISESRYLIGTQSYLKGRISLPARRRPGRDSESVTKTGATNKNGRFSGAGDHRQTRLSAIFLCYRADCRKIAAIMKNRECSAFS
ncbi:hypothetical protein [Burkholderia plantarii]|uniref:hypothetical protein n=1 Tax=Burkholderia plantarii TaxID=41899 RepID=UPI000F4DEA84|nr:hypothetical protein [Burkholderia plantarii]